MARLLAIILLVVCVSCDHKTQKQDSGPAPEANASGRPESTARASDHIPHSHTCIVTAAQGLDAWAFKMDFPPDPVDIVGLRFTLRGKSGLARFAVSRTASPVVASLPKLNADGLLDEPSKSVEVYFEKPIPAGSAITGAIAAAFVPAPASDFPVTVTLLQSRVASAAPIASADPHHRFAEFVRASYDFWTLARPVNGLLEQQRVLGPDKIWRDWHKYSYYGWILIPTPHAGLTVPIDVPCADDFEIRDVLPDDVDSVRLQAEGFKLSSVFLDGNDAAIEGATADVVLETRGDRFHQQYFSKSGIVDITIRLVTRTNTESAGLLELSAHPMDSMMPLRGSIRFTYQKNGEK